MPANFTSASSQKFLDTLESWFGSQREILALFRYSHAAGSRDFEFFSSFQALVDRICDLPPLTSVIVFRKPQLPIRGIVDDEFISRCLASIPDGSEYLIVETVRRVYGRKSWFHHDSGIAHAGLREDLEECRGAYVAAGLCPDWLKDSEDVISAIVPDEQGNVRVGVY